VEKDGVSHDEAWRRSALWKTNLKATYTQLFFKPQHRAKFASLMANGLVRIFPCGMVGWTERSPG
jgi:hypothetical protein